MDRICIACGAVALPRDYVKGCCRRCYWRWYRHSRYHGGAPAGDERVITGATLRQLRYAWGWSQRQIGDRFYFDHSTVWRWEHDHHPIPAHVVAWLRGLGEPPRVAGYPPTAAGICKYLSVHHLRCLDLAEFVGVHETAVERWALGITPVPLSIRAWMHAGCPPTWPWSPPGSDREDYRRQGKHSAAPTRQSRPSLGRQRPYYESLIARRWRGVTRPRKAKKAS